jgi:hypothetical protein
MPGTSAKWRESSRMRLSRLSDQESHPRLSGIGRHGTPLNNVSQVQRYESLLKSRDVSLTLLRQDAYPDPEQGSPSKSCPRITLVHGFYAAMGGYVVQSHFLDGQHPFTGQGRLTLTKEGMIRLLQNAPEIFPNLTEDEILDKSKASTLVKTLTCLQAFWFCLQCVVRLTMSTSISLLELNVFGHCVCTFIIYAIWWNKPMDIYEPTILEIEDRPDLQGLVALLCSYTSMTVPRLPHPLAECVVQGHEYRPQDHSSLSWFRAQPDHLDYWNARYRGSLNTRFYDMDSSVRSERVSWHIGRGPHAHSNERQVYECAGLRIEQVRQLLNLDECNSLV